MMMEELYPRQYEIHRVLECIMSISSVENNPEFGRTWTAGVR